MFYLRRALCYSVTVLCIHFPGKTTVTLAQKTYLKCRIIPFRKLNMFKLAPDVSIVRTGCQLRVWLSCSPQPAPVWAELSFSRQQWSPRSSKTRSALRFPGTRPGGFLWGVIITAITSKVARTMITFKQSSTQNIFFKNLPLNVF